jgi:hypothetical protein
MITFDDGISIDTSGELRITHLRDGYYVVGKGMSIPVDSYEEGKQVIAEMKDADK